MAEQEVQQVVDAHVERMLTESRELTQRIGKLSIFVSSEGSAFETLPALEQHLLASQLMTMQAYSALLDMRIKLSTDRGVFLAETE